MPRRGETWLVKVGSTSDLLIELTVEQLSLLCSEVKTTDVTGNMLICLKAPAFDSHRPEWSSLRLHRIQESSCKWNLTLNIGYLPQTLLPVVVSHLNELSSEGLATRTRWYYKVKWYARRIVPLSGKSKSSRNGRHTKSYKFLTACLTLLISGMLCSAPCTVRADKQRPFWNSIHFQRAGGRPSKSYPVTGAGGWGRWGGALWQHCTVH